MRYATHTPPSDLAHLVRFWWTLESDAGITAPHRLTAECCPNIVTIVQGRFTEADGSPSPPVHLAGALPHAVDNVAHGPFSLFGVYLWPWAVQPLFDRSPATCFARFIALDELWGNACTGLSEALLNASDHSRRITIMSGALRERSAQGSESDPILADIVQRMIEAQGLLSVQEALQHCGLARRQFERRFKACTGFSPALFLRILRFQSTYRLLEHGEASSLTDLAMAAGYFDQSHFIRDFKRFSGMNPRDYFAKAPDKVDNFVRLP
ncbi:MAG TPA: helix-turn-helix domain-containing protein [Flavobacteriales bacterium]